MIIGTAGHIDHGKTTLVRALTGVDTDRLPEEKRRGISIELGYAYLQEDDGQGGTVSLGFVDVPGHERLLHTMLAGATGIDHALLVVAADDGVMPQTREHLAVLSLLGLDAGTVVITKADRLAPAERERRLAALRTELAALLATTALAGAPVFVVSAGDDAAVARLRTHLASAARAGRSRDGGQVFRLAADRSFTLAGVGTVATGTASSGHVTVGDELVQMPGDRRVRVRSLHAQNRPAESARAGQRCALALAGVAKEEVARGDWLCAPAAALATERLDVELTLWPGEARALRSGTPVHVHLGASDIVGTVALLDREALAPGECGLAQLVLRARTGAWHGDRGVLRDASATRTVAGVRVLDPFAPVRWRRTPERLATLAAWQHHDAAGRMAALLACAPLGLDTARAARAQALPSEDALPLPADTVRYPGGAISPPHFEALQATVRGRLAQFHADAPDEIGPDARRLRRLAAPRADDALWRHLQAALLADGTVAQSGSWLHLPEHAARLGEAEERIAQQVMPRLLAGGFDPPWVRDLARDCQLPEAMVRQTLAGLARRGAAFQVVRDLYYLLPVVEQLAGIARDCLAHPAGLQAASFRDATGLGRKRAIQLLEFFDRVGFTRRVKDVHLIRPDTVLFAQAP